jgi:RND family efflux transporter MFP subunit
MDNKKPRKVVRLLSFLCGIAALVLLMLYMAGVFVPDKIGPGKIPAEKRKWIPKAIASAVRETVTDFYKAPGTVRPRQEIRIESRVQGRIVDVPVRPGDVVKTGDRLVVLDSRELQARLSRAKQAVLSARARREQAAQGVHFAEAGFKRAEAAYNRVITYFKSEAATKQQMEEAEENFHQARAGLSRARESLKEGNAGVRQAEKGVDEARIVQDYTEIRSDAHGQVVERLVEPGDMAFPGKPLLVLQTRGLLRLEALVPEGFIHRIKPGGTLKVVIPAVKKSLSGPVSEIIPSADPATRSFLVKVDLPETKGLYPGMFGRLLVPVGEISVVWIPEKALERVGQLEMVRVKSGEDWMRIYVTTGRVFDNRVEVLSGLNGGEAVSLGGDAQ